MTITYNFNTHFLIRLCILCSLIFFVPIFLFSCHENQQKEVSLVWNNHDAVAIAIPGRLLDASAKPFNKELLQVRVEKSVDVMLGEVTMEDGQVIFRPIVPLSRGFAYEIVFDKKVVSHIKVPSADPANAPKLVNVYPTADTLPENLLKMYLRFSRPMREGESLKHVALLDYNNDTVQDVFLDLQPELWNTERTVLTIRLDPGRIKRELIPNQQLGNPLKKGERYTLAVSADWRDVQALPLQQPFAKQFIVGSRDSIFPDVAKWNLRIPPAGSTEPIDISLREPLDNYLLSEAIRVIDEKGQNVNGNIKVAEKETKVLFIPGKKWETGKYRLRVEATLEDVAGNNLNRPFDRDTWVKNGKAEQSFAERTFEITD